MFQVVHGVCITLLFSYLIFSLRVFTCVRVLRACTPGRTCGRVRENVRFDFR